MSPYSTSPADDFEVWESLQLFDFPARDPRPDSEALESGFPFTAILLGARKRGEMVRIDTVGGRRWGISPRAVGKTWFSGVTDTPERGVVLALAAIVECRASGPPDGDASEVNVSLSRAIAVTAQHTKTIRVTTTEGSRDGVVRELGRDYLRLYRRALDGGESHLTIPFSRLVAVEFLGAGDIS